jgi:hypothetical protein
LISRFFFLDSTHLRYSLSLSSFRFVKAACRRRASQRGGGAFSSAAAVAAARRQTEGAPL